MRSLRTLVDALKREVSFQKQRIESRLQNPASRRETQVFLAGVGIGVLLLFLWLYIGLTLPSLSDVREARRLEASVVLTQDGQLIASFDSRERRWVPYDSIAPVVVDALIATEDHRFYKHFGIDPQRLVLAPLRGQGGSTLHMQFARNHFTELQAEPVVIRKFKELVLAFSLNAMYSKEEMIEMYLNTVSFMFNAYGIEAGAQTYFQKPAAELDTLEAATLIGMLKGTVLFNPQRNPERSHRRRNVVLGQMVKRGMVTQAWLEAHREERTALRFQRITREGRLAQHLADQIRQDVELWADEAGVNLYRQGLRIYTTLDGRMQSAAETSVREAGNALQTIADVEWSAPELSVVSSNPAAYRRVHDPAQAFAHLFTALPTLLDEFLRTQPRYAALLNAGLAPELALDSLRREPTLVDSARAALGRLEIGLFAMDPRDGAVRVWVGGRRYTEAQFDHVAVARRQPGSTFKPFVFAAALASGAYSPDHTLMDSVMTFTDPASGQSWRPTNAGSATGSYMTLRRALALSKNTITAQLMVDPKVGAQAVVDVARALGIESPLTAVPSLGLGTSDVTLYEMATAYASLARMGTRQQPYVLDRVTDRNGTVLHVFPRPEPQPAIDPSVAFDVVDMLRDVITSGTGSALRWRYGVQGDWGGKTGTTQRGADGWFIAMHPYLVTGAWVGFATPSVTFRSGTWSQASRNALWVVGDFLRRAQAAAPEALPADVRFQQPAGYIPRQAPPLDTTFILPDSLLVPLDDIPLALPADSLGR